ncbi:MAG: 2-methylcitrate dehydratase [Roseomonas sp.]|nr:2-methylcitrate dehydratase [Roseomonas sp.]
MDKVLHRLAEETAGLRHEDITPEARHDTVRRILDTIGCALAAFEAEPVRLARAYARRVQGGAHLLGTDHRTSEELAGFVNGIMARVMEGNDAYPGGGGHPSDSILAILAVAEARGGSGRDTVTAVWLAYQVHFALFRALQLRDTGLDHVFYTAVATAAGVARLLDLSVEATRHALALAATANLALHATRVGGLSMWKGGAGANAARNGSLAALLAAEGMTGPEAPIDGHHGLLELIGPREIGGFVGQPDAMLTRACYKFLLSEYHAQGPVMAALSLKVAPEAIERLDVFTYHFTWSEIGSGPEKWDPRTPEAADHSLPYVLAATLVDGAYSDAIYAQERLKDPRIRALMPRIFVQEDPALTSIFPRAYPCRLVLTRRDGERQEVTLDNPPGHPDQPLSDAQISEKFRGLARRVLPSERVEALLDWLWGLEAQGDVAALFGLAQIDR